MIRRLVTWWRSRKHDRDLPGVALPGDWKHINIPHPCRMCGGKGYVSDYMRGPDAAVAPCPMCEAP